MRLRFGLLGLVLALVGCTRAVPMTALSSATPPPVKLSRYQCLDTDWFQVGYKDGFKHHRLRDMDAIRKACEKHNVYVDIAEYYAGVKEGAQAKKH